jgi:hypothetical protein
VFYRKIKHVEALRQDMNKYEQFRERHGQDVRVPVGDGQARNQATETEPQHG